ncbi:DUF1772 domain-containing protein [Emticicia sp. TH156]|uniref:DUF1772 domain-containing protein n=1 Tax=Emticicia sp. TH156 TaxID=2067454 RepID=UPI000C778A87|nr:DUF1772 domain-containing protein [Emticicia sp. TH156]PLK43385.1 hypothetical protein C0V77_15875 [Emticicia sp. TH156]
MEHKLDEFFRKKIADTEDELPENSGFDEGMFWGELQKNMHKPQPNGWWKWVAVAACLAGVMAWTLLLNKPATHVPEYNVAIRTPKAIAQPETFAKAIAPKLKTPQHNTIKKKIIAPIKDIKPEIEVMAVRMPEPVIVTQTIKQDSIHFQPPVVAETKPKFKTVHVNEISSTENEAIPQPKFKIRFAARNLP